MAENLTSSDVLEKLSLPENDQTRNEFSLSGLLPGSISSTDVKRTITILGITPEHFSKNYSTTEFDFEMLEAQFALYCKDYGLDLEENKLSKALEFSSKMLFEIGPYIRNERKSKGDKAVRFRFPYVKTDSDGSKTLSIKVVIVTTFKDMTYDKNEADNKLILTFKQAGLLATQTFLKAIEFCYMNNGAILMTPLCGAVFSRDSIAEMSKELNLEYVSVISMLNASTTAGGQYLLESNLACAVIAMISATKRVSDKNLRNSMLTKLVKQYSGKKKTFDHETFKVVSKYALGGVPPGLDPETLITTYENIQSNEVSLRARAKAQMESEIKVRIGKDGATREDKPDKSASQDTLKPATSKQRPDVSTPRKGQDIKGKKQPSAAEMTLTDQLIVSKIKGLDVYTDEDMKLIQNMVGTGQTSRLESLLKQGLDAHEQQKSRPETPDKPGSSGASGASSPRTGPKKYT